MIGARKRNSNISCCSVSPAKRSSSAAGSSAVAHRRHDARCAPEGTVREDPAPPLTPACNSPPAHAHPLLQALIRAGVSPLCIAEISTTMAPKNTLRPRNRSDGGVSRLRQPSAAQHRLKRRVLRSEPGRAAAGFARERAPVQLRPALLTSTRVRRVRRFPGQTPAAVRKIGCPSASPVSSDPRPSPAW